MKAVITLNYMENVSDTREGDTKRSLSVMEW